MKVKNFDVLALIVGAVMLGVGLCLIFQQGNGLWWTLPGGFLLGFGLTEVIDARKRGK